MAAGVLDPSKYHCSALHLAVLKKQHPQLEGILAGLQPVADPSSIRTVAAARADIDVADARSSVVDYRDGRTGRETPLHLAVRTADPASVLLLMEAGADWTLQNDRGWNALDEAVHLGHEDIARTIFRHSKRIQLEKWCRRRPIVVRALKLIRDFYAEITFHFESSLLPFVSRMLPSDTVRILKRGSDVRVDTTLAGLEVFKTRRSERSILFLGESCGSLWVLSHRDRVAKAFDGKRDPPTDGEVEDEVARMMKKRPIRPGLDVTECTVEPARRVKTESVGPWSAKAYRMKNAVLSLKSRRALGASAAASSSSDGSPYDIWGNPEELREHLTEEELRKLDSTLSMIESPQTMFDDSSSVVESAGDAESTCNNTEEDGEGGGKQDKKEKKNKKGLFKNLKKKCSKLTQDAQKKIAPLDIKGRFSARRAATATANATSAASDDGQDDPEVEYKIKFKPDLWLSDEFPLEVKELLPLLDILGQKSKMILRLREVLTTKFPYGTFPVKVSFPIMRTIKVTVTFTKFEELKPSVEFFTPPTSPETEASGAKPLSSLSITKEEPYFYDPLVMSVSDIKDPFRIPSDYRRT